MYVPMYSIKIPMFHILMMAFLNMIYRTLCQECAFPNERCICLTSTPVCNCPYITASSTLNFTTGYNSHLVMGTGLGCLPCPANCLSCTSINTCTSCRSEYVLIGNICAGCPINCKQCQLASTVVSGQPYPLICTQCISTYYLDSQNQCQVCPLPGSNVCTVDTLISCLPSYYLDSNGATCISCDPNCNTCSSTTKCSICNDGYYMNNYKCFKCMAQCSTCVNSNACTACLSSNMYFNISTAVCMLCPTGCLTCTNSSYCLTCGDQSSNSYILTSNYACVITSNPLPNCQLHQNISSSLKCIQCNTDYFQQLLSSSCSYSCSILCQQCQGAHYGLCTSCQSQYATLFNRQCLPKNNINNGSAYQIYYTAMNNFNTSNIVTNNYTLITRLINNCLKQSILYNNILSIKLDNLQAYKLTFLWKIYIFSNHTFSYLLTYNNTNITSSYPFGCSKVINETGCNSICIDKNTLTIESSILQYNALSFQNSDNIASIGLSEILIIAYRCGGVQGSSCLQCSSINLCTKCVNPTYFVLGSGCVQECPPSYYIYYENRNCYVVCPMGTFPQTNNNGSQICQKCPIQCMTCTSNSTCLSCNTGFFLLSSTQQCLSSCPSRYFPNTYMHTCQKCLYPCLQCQSNRQCLSCIYGFYDNTTQACTITCPTQYYGNLKSRLCEPCDPPCLTCQLTSTMCIQCLPEYILFYGLCYSSCPQGYYISSKNLSSSSFQCLPCNISCLTCSSADTCTACSSSFLLNSTCYMSCPMGYYASLTTKKCQQCITNCLSCPNATHCSLCRTPYILDIQLYTCVEKCKQAQYAQQQTYTSLAQQSNPNNTYYVCRSCITPCFTCTSPTSCLSCISSFLLNFSCLDTCVFGTYPNQLNLTCTACPNPCSTCQSQSLCTSCNSGYILYSSSCLSQCPPFYYIYIDSLTGKDVCLACSLDCYKCLNETFCLNCTVGLFSTMFGICTDTCPPGYFGNISSRSCQKCMPYCSLCKYNSISNSQQCLVCTSPFILGNAFTCVQQCDVFQFDNNGVCYDCVQPCKSCASQSQCIGCRDGYGYAIMGDCVAECPYGYYENDDAVYGYTCKQCPSSCLSCRFNANLSIPICAQCKNGYYLNKINGTCIVQNECPLIIDSLNPHRSYFADYSSRYCAQCQSKCKNCEGQANNCSQCNNGYYLFGTKCMHICPNGYFGTNLTCISCDISYNYLNPQNKIVCTQCKSSNLCTSCSSSYYLYSPNTTYSICLQICPNGYFGYAQLCYLCVYPCLTCNSLTNCTSCVSQYAHLINTNSQQTCVFQCPNGYYKSTSNNNTQCLSCIHPCLQCTSSSVCLICNPPYVLVNSSCQSSCPSATFQFYGTCSLCMHGCSNCTDAYTCLQCNYGFLYQGQCITACPYGLIQQTNGNTSVCIQCSTQCLTCTIQPHTCTSCKAGLYLYLQSCILSCPSGSYANSELYQCVTCNLPCQTCINSVSCQTCIYGYILYIEPSRNQCVKGPLCPNSFFLDLQTNQCVFQCDFHKYTQPISKICSATCPSGFTSYAQNMTCLYECPGKDSWVDENKKCQQNKSLLNPSFITNNLPYFSCSISNYRNLLQIHCNFSIQISNLNSIIVDNITIQNLRILYLQKSINNKYFKIFVQPFDITNKGINKFINQWITISVRPRYSLKTYTNTSLNKLRLLEQEKGSYPLQNSDSIIFIPLFNFYTLEQRETGIYLQQLSNSISIAALIIWLFSFLKNKKSMALVWINGIQWLYMLSILAWNQFPPNVLHFLEGFRYSFLIFVSSQLSNTISSSNQVLWALEMEPRAQLYAPINLMDYKTIAIPLVCYIAFFVFLYFILAIVRAVTKKFSEIREQQRDEEKEKQSVTISWHNPSTKTDKVSKGKTTQNQSKKQQKHYNLSEDVYKKLTIILQRFKFNYVNHALLFISLPLSLLFFSQIMEPNIIGILIACVLIILQIISLFFIVKQLINKKHPLYKEQSYKYYIFFILQNVLIGFICIFGTMTFFMGINAIVSIFNIIMYFRIFRPLEWKLKFWIIADCLKLVIVASLMISYVMAQELERDTLFQYGWVPVIFIFIYALMLATITARDFFEQESVAFKQLIEQEKDAKQRKKTKIIQNLLKSTKFINQSMHDLNTNILAPIISSSSVVQYETEESFFEDEQEVKHTDSQDENAINFSDTTSQADHKNKGWAGAPKVLIKQKKTN